MSLREWWWDEYAPYCTASKAAESLEAISETPEQRRVDSFIWMSSSCLHENWFFLQVLPWLLLSKKTNSAVWLLVMQDTDGYVLCCWVSPEFESCLCQLLAIRCKVYYKNAFHSYFSAIPPPLCGLRDKNRPGTHQSMLFQGYFPFLQYFSFLFMWTQGPKLESTSPREKLYEKWIHKNFSASVSTLFCSCRVNLH